MAEPKLVKMGIRRKDMHPKETVSPKSDKDYDKEEVRPSIRLEGAHAEMLGAENLKKGDRVRQMCEWVVTEHVKRDENGKPPHYTMTWELDRGGDLEECGNEKTDDDEASVDSPAMAYIQGRAKEA